MKKSLLALFILVVLLGVFYLLTPREVIEPEIIVDSFYSEWMGSEINPIANKIYQESNYVTSDFVLRLDNVINSFEDGMAYDPVLCAQDFPSDIEFSLLSKQDKQAEVLVIGDFWGQPKEIRVLLVLINKGWLVDDIICPEVSLANPASVYCESQGGIVEIRTQEDGGQIGFCLINDLECEEWAFFRGECN